MASLVNFAGPATTRGSGGPPRVKHLLRPITRGFRSSLDPARRRSRDHRLPSRSPPSFSRRHRLLYGQVDDDPRLVSADVTIVGVRATCEDQVLIGGPGARPSRLQSVCPFGDTSSPSRNGARAGSTGIRPTAMSSLSAQSTMSVVACRSRAAPAGHALSGRLSMAQQYGEQPGTRSS